MSTHTQASFIQAAEDKFGKVIEFQNNIFLIQREKGLSCAPLDRYMTIEAGIVNGNIAFHNGDYDMSLVSAARNLAMRAKNIEQLNKLEVEKQEIVRSTKEDTLNEFIEYLDTYIDDEITEGTPMSDILTSDALDVVKMRFLQKDQNVVAA